MKWNMTKPTKGPVHPANPLGLLTLECPPEEGLGSYVQMKDSDQNRRGVQTDQSLCSALDTCVIQFDLLCSGSNKN